MTTRCGSEAGGIRRRVRPRPSVLCIVLAAACLAGCEPAGPGHEAATAVREPGREPERGPVPRRSGAPTDTPGQGVAVLASGFESIVPGMDGSLYEAYGTGAILLAQGALRQRGLYRGPLNGVLDRPTMQAIYEFQSASLGLDRTGVPSPRTRFVLEQGSHTF